MSEHEFRLEKLNRRLVGAIFLNEFVVFLSIENLLNFCHLPMMPEDFILEALDSFLQILRTFQCPALTTCNRDWIKMAGNGFSAFTDREFVLSVKAAVLDFSEAEVLSVGGCLWVHIAMMFVVLLGCLRPSDFIQTWDWRVSAVSLRSAGLLWFN